jgi:hypothetical protein
MSLSLVALGIWILMMRGRDGLVEVGWCVWYGVVRGWKNIWGMACCWTFLVSLGMFLLFSLIDFVFVK